MSGLAVMLCITLSLHGAAVAPELAPYAALVQRHAAADSLLAAARAGLARGFDLAASAAPPPGAWPGSPRPVYLTLVHARTTRACVGTDAPYAGGPAGTLFQLGAQLVSSDRRHPPLEAGELDTLKLVVAFASDPEPIADPMLVSPMREGLKIESERGAIAFLPGEARTIAWALAEARRVGVLVGPLSDAHFSRFSVVTFQGPAHTSQESAP